MCAKDAVEFCAAGQSMDMNSSFADSLAASGGDRQHPSNYSRDLLRMARRELEVNFLCYSPLVVLRDPLNATVEKPVATLLPYEVAHWLWEFNCERFFRLSRKPSSVNTGAAQSSATRFGFSTIPCDKPSLTRKTGHCISRFNYSEMMALFENPGPFKRSPGILACGRLCQLCIAASLVTWCRTI